MTSSAAAPVVYAGIDEAGYGPLLGPLCIGMAVFEITNWSPGAPAPDLWQSLRAAICRSAAETKSGRIAVNDSKRLKLSNDSRTRHPLVHLERGVLAFLHAAEHTVTTDAELLTHLGVTLDGLEWYAGEPVPIPLGSDHAMLRLCGARLSGALDGAGVRILDLCARTVDERTFNDRLAGSGGKAGVSFGIVANCLRRVWKSQSTLACADAGGPRVVVDRQGGRTAYAELLAVVFENAHITTVAETPTVSQYEVVGHSADDGRRMHVRFQVEAEEHHLPVALASMTAKLVRELAMHRFNRYWCARIAELKPTAGYATDGRRWLRDVQHHATREELLTLERRA